jgi:hypothetical protein
MGVRPNIGGHGKRGTEVAGFQQDAALQEMIRIVSTVKCTRSDRGSDSGRPIRLTIERQNGPKDAF